MSPHGDGRERGGGEESSETPMTILPLIVLLIGDSIMLLLRL